MSINPEGQRVVLLGGTGDVGLRIARALRERGADVTALVRPGSTGEPVDRLRRLGVEPAEADLGREPDVSRACEGAVCVVSALSGLRETVVDAQSAVLRAAVAAGAPRFIPSDFSIDYRGLPLGSNRNFDLRREFAAKLDEASIKATSIFNGAFADMLTDQAPIILPKLKRVLYVGNADQKIDFTTRDDTAAFTARAALDAEAPRALHVAGDRISAREIAEVMSERSGQRYRLFRAGSLGALSSVIKVVRTLAPQPKNVFSPWQGLQYMHNMFSGEAGLPRLDNDRYPDIRWARVRDLLPTR